VSSLLLAAESQEFGWPGAVVVVAMFAFAGFVIWCMTK
jgi:cyanate permease